MGYGSGQRYPWYFPNPAYCMPSIPPYLYIKAPRVTHLLTQPSHGYHISAPVTLGSTQLSEQSIVHLLSKGNNQIFIIICNSLNNHLLGLLVVQFLLLFLYLYNKIFVLSTLSVFVSLSITLLSCRCPLGLGYHELLNY